MSAVARSVSVPLNFGINFCCAVSFTVCVLCSHRRTTNGDKHQINVQSRGGGGSVKQNIRGFNKHMDTPNKGSHYCMKSLFTRVAPPHPPHLFSPQINESKSRNASTTAAARPLTPSAVATSCNPSCFHRRRQRKGRGTGARKEGGRGVDKLAQALIVFAV